MKKGKLRAAKSYNAFASYGHGHRVIGRHLTPNGLFGAARRTFRSIIMCSTPSPLSQFSPSLSHSVPLSLSLSPSPFSLSFCLSQSLSHSCLPFLPLFEANYTCNTFTNVKNRAMCFMIVLALLHTIRQPFLLFELDEITMIHKLWLEWLCDTLLKEQ